jgi:hypothetical protein
MREILAIAKTPEQDFVILFEYDREQFKAFTTLLAIREGKVEEYDFNEPLEYEINLIKKYQQNGWIISWAYGIV